MGPLQLQEDLATRLLREVPRVNFAEVTFKAIRRKMW